MHGIMRLMKEWEIRLRSVLKTTLAILIRCHCVKSIDFRFWKNGKVWLFLLLVGLKSIPNNEIPGNDGLSKESYEIFWDDIKYFNDFVKTSQIRR